MPFVRPVVAAAITAVCGLASPLAPAFSAVHAHGAEVQKLEIGMPAPALTAVDWLKGPQSPQFDEGTVYVMDFWATWCGPCIAAMPHLRSLQEKYADRDVEFIGVAIWPRNGQVPTSQWIADPPERVGEVTWAIAEDIEGQTARTYMNGLGQGGIPTVVIVDRGGTIAWVGHPMQMDSALDQIVEGTYSVENQVRSQELMSEAREAAAAGEWETVLTKFDEIIELDPSWAVQLGINGYLVRRDRLEDLDAAAAHGRKFIDEYAGDDPDALNSFAWNIVNPNMEIETEQRHLDLAIEAAEKAVGITERKSADILDTLAHAYYFAKRYDDAISAQSEAVDLTEVQRQREAYERTLAMFEKAKADAASAAADEG